jgi:hypothetical protein
MSKKCKGQAEHFSFQMEVNPSGMNCGFLNIEGFGCIENGKANADIDSVEYEGTEIKPVLELLGGMYGIDTAAEQYVKEQLTQPA